MTPGSAILVTIDGLGYDRVGFGGGRGPSTPVLDAAAAAGLCCTRAYANSWYTQFSFPSLFTSTLPLDYGGYDLGVATRPTTLADALRRRGFRTAAFSSDPCLNAFYGYDRGFDEVHELFDLRRLWDHVRRDYLAHFAEWRAAGLIDADDARRRAADLVGRLLGYCAGYCERRRTAGGRQGSVRSTPLDAIDIDAWAAEVASLTRDLERSPDLTLDQLLARAHEPRRVPGSARQETRRSAGAALVDRLAAAFGAYPPKRDQCAVDARDMLSTARDWIERQGDGRFFAWVSLNDVHDRNFCHRWLSGDTVRHRIRTLGRAPDTGGLATDLAVRFVDRELGRFLRALERSGRRESTLVVVCADHGTPDDAAGFDLSFGDRLVRVPMVFVCPGRDPAVCRMPCSLLDLAPTMLDMLAVPPEPAFRGFPIGSARHAARDFVTIEQLGGGPCDLARRTPTVCLVGRDYKYAVTPDGRGFVNDLAGRPPRGFVPEGDAPVAANVERLRAGVDARLAEIRAQTGGRACT